MSKRIWKKGLTWCALATLSLSQVSLAGQGVVQAADTGVTINHQTTLPNEIKTYISGTVNSIADLSNGNVKVKLTTKSETDPDVVDSMLLDGALQFNADSKFIVEAGNPTDKTETSAGFDPTANGSLPQVRYTNVGTTKSGDKIDAVWEITKYRKPNEDSRFSMRISSTGALALNCRNLGGVEFTFHLYKAGTTTPANLLLFPAINDVDFRQAFQLSNATLLGHGSNLTLDDAGILVSDERGVDDIVDFPLGGALYQYYGSAMKGLYNSKDADDVNVPANGFDMFGSHGSMKHIEIVKPDFGPVKIPKARWEVKQSKLSAKDEVAFDFVQPINALDKDINHRYKNWETRFTLPEHLKDAKIELVDEAGKVIPTTQKRLSDGRYEVIVTSATMKKLSFDGETYRFKITGQVSDKTVNQSSWTLTAETTVDNLKDKVVMKTKPITNKVPVTLTYTRKGTQDEVAKTKHLEVGYGQPWDLKASTTVEGYLLDTTNKPVLMGKRVDFQEKNIDLFYIPRKQSLQVNYLLEDGIVLGKDSVPAFYHEAYGTSASDIDDMYSLVTEKLPKNAAGFLKSENETINYYYRKTNGYWVELNYGAQAITRLDYRGNIRSNGIDYSDGEVITLINADEKSLLVHHDHAEKGALSQQHLKPGQSVNVTLVNGDSVNVSLAADGKATIVRESAGYTMTSVIQRGNWENTTQIYDWRKQLVEEQITHVNGVAGQILSRFTKQYADGLVATSNVLTNGKVKPNTTANDVAGTTFKRSVKLTPKVSNAASLAMITPATVKSDNDTSKNDKLVGDDTTDSETAKQDDDTNEVIKDEETSSSEKADKTSESDEIDVTEDGSQDTVDPETVEPVLSFEDDLVVAPVNKDTAFDEAMVGDVVDDDRALQGLADKHKIDVYEGDKLLKSETVGTGEKVMLQKPDVEEHIDIEMPLPLPKKQTPGKEEPKSPELPIVAQPNQAPKVLPEAFEVTPKADGNMTTREPGGNPTGKTSGHLPGTGSDMTYWLTVLGLSSLILSLVGFFVIRGGKKHV